MMRLVTYTGVCDETAYATYLSNDTTAAITTKGFIGGEKHQSVHLIELTATPLT